LKSTFKCNLGKLLAVVMTLMMTITSISFAAPNENASTAFDKKILSRIDSERASKHISYLTETIGPRVAGTQEERQAAEYIQKELQSYGYKAYIQEFAINNVVSNLAINSLDNKIFRANTATGSGYTTASGVTAKIVNCGLGNSPDEFPAEVMGNIALVQRGVQSFAIKAENAVNAGAAAVIIYNNAPGTLNPTLGTYVSPVPVLAITLADGASLVKEIESKEQTATIKAQHLTKSWNVIAERESKNQNKAADQIVYVTAHYDSVPFAPGANDNASGTAMLLEFARILKAYPTDKEVRFIACGAEEIGLVGSTYYVNQLSADEVSRSVANFNMDMIATSYEPCDILYADTVSGQPNLVTEKAVASGARLGNNITELGRGSSSDHAPFGRAGIAAACFIWGDANGNLEPWYHQPEDTIAINISLDRLQQAGEIVGSALYDVIRTATPNLENSVVRKPVIESYDFGATE
jgi:aminopeptidase YwaD